MSFDPAHVKFNVRLTLTVYRFFLLIAELLQNHVVCNCFFALQERVINSLDNIITSNLKSQRVSLKIFEKIKKYFNCRHIPHQPAAATSFDQPWHVRAFTVPTLCFRTSGTLLLKSMYLKSCAIMYMRFQFSYRSKAHA